jgi:hypothetical protein
MHILRRYTNRIEGIYDFAKEVSFNKISQGVVIDINPVWLHAYLLDRAGLNPDALHMPWSFMEEIALHNLYSQNPIEGDAIDFGWIDKSGWVNNVTRHMLNSRGRPIAEPSLPFVVKAIAKPASPEFFETRAQLVALATRQNFFALVETRPLGRLAAAPGDACLAGGVPGTIGGFLRDQNTNRVYAATCGHVASQGASVDISGKPLGVCSHSCAPLQQPPGQLCAPGCPEANKLDLALIDLGNATVANVVTGVAAQIGCKQSIVLRGGMSLINTFEVGGILMTYCPGESNVCFENMFEVRLPYRSGIINPRVRAAFATVPTQGDSGGWIETADRKWCGVLVAVDGSTGYALEADDTLYLANATFGMDLQLA